MLSPLTGYYATGDAAIRRQTAKNDSLASVGYYGIAGRTDDVINVSGIRIGTAEIESALASHPLVAESAVVDFPHPIKGSGIYAFVTLREAGEKAVAAAPDPHAAAEKLKTELRDICKKGIARHAAPDIMLVRCSYSTSLSRFVRVVLYCSVLKRTVERRLYSSVVYSVERVRAQAQAQVQVQVRHWRYARAILVLFAICSQPAMQLMQSIGARQLRVQSLSDQSRAASFRSVGAEQRVRELSRRRVLVCAARQVFSHRANFKLQSSYEHSSLHTQVEEDVANYMCAS